MEELTKCAANYAPLTPINFLHRAAGVYSDRTSVVYGSTRFTWKQTYHRCRRLAATLRSLGINKNDVVSVLAPNIPAMYEMHFAVPMAGAVLNTINTRLDANGVATILQHSGAKMLFVDHEYLPLARDVLNHLTNMITSLPLVVVIDDVDAPTGVELGDREEYEQLVARGDPAWEPQELEDEWDAIALNYTSGTTSAPKGVVYSHRGAYLSTLTLLLQWGVGSEPVYLWSLPMFHCNGWTLTWGVAARGGTNVCIRSPTAAAMRRAISAHRVTHMCCAPVLLTTLLEVASDAPVAPPVQVMVGGAPPLPALLQQVECSGFHVTHAYGMTEATGPALVCEWRAQWDGQPATERARIKARQGVSVLSLADVDVRDGDTMRSVPRDGRTMGEIMLRGSSIMKGYLKNKAEMAAAMSSGWFRTGDLGVVHSDGYVEIMDRLKDVIISGGENISSVEVEAVLYRHPAVREAAVVAMPHPRWGETPCAFVAVKEVEGRRAVGEEDIIEFCKSNMSRFMAPKKVVVVEELPKTSTGKVQKNKLRELARGFQVSWKSQEAEKVTGSSEMKNIETNGVVHALSRL